MRRGKTNCNEMLRGGGSSKLDAACLSAFTKPSRATRIAEQSERRQIIIGNHAFRFDLERWRLTKRTNETKLSCVSLSAKLMRGAVAFTLAETLITLGIIGVVAAVTLPVLLTNVQERVRNEQVRTVKYKLTLATDKMKSMGLLQESYTSTEDFVNELKKHFKVAKVCNNNNLTECWPTEKINAYVNGVLTEVNVADLKTGSDIVALGLGTKITQTTGIITGDGTPIILTYSPKCSALEPEKTYTWSTVDNKPETNATTNCISAIFDVNGKAKPNRVGQDVRTFNSLFGYKLLGKSYNKLDNGECARIKDKLGINKCRTSGDDYWGGAVKACHESGLHLPSLQTLANMAGSRYGISNVGPTTYITSSKYAGYNSCNEYYASQTYKSNLKTYGSVVCIDTGASNTITTDTATSLPDTITSVNSYFCSASEVSAAQSQTRRIHTGISNRDKRNRNTSYRALCLGD